MKKCPQTHPNEATPAPPRKRKVKRRDDQPKKPKWAEEGCKKFWWLINECEVRLFFLLNVYPIFVTKGLVATKDLVD